MISEIRFRAAPPGWKHTDPNPFLPDGAFDGAWSAFCFTEKDDNQYFTGQEGCGPFSARFGSRVPHLEQRLVDFLRYENRHGRTVIVSGPPGMDLDAYIGRALSSAQLENTVRAEDPAVLVHATTADAWRSIQSDGAMKAASQIAKKTHRQNRFDRPNPVEEYLLREPPEYFDYIMFGEVDSYNPEMVVASYAAGAFLWDADMEFTPGVRLYLDNHRIIRDGLATRDGLHLMKVLYQLPLQPYLLAAVGVEQIDPEGRAPRWTIRSFVDAANGRFTSSRV